MTDKAINALDKNKNGFFLILKVHRLINLHEMDWQRATYDTLEFDKAVKFAVIMLKKIKIH